MGFAFQMRAPPSSKPVRFTGQQSHWDREVPSSPDNPRSKVVDFLVKIDGSASVIKCVLNWLPTQSKEPYKQSNNCCCSNNWLGRLSLMRWLKGRCRRVVNASSPSNGDNLLIFFVWLLLHSPQLSKEKSEPS